MRSLLMCSFVAIPTNLFLGFPPVKIMNVGTLKISSLAASTGDSSTLTFTNLTLPPNSFASEAIIGAITWHGPHQGAQNSTKIEALESITFRSHSVSLIGSTNSVFIVRTLALTRFKGDVEFLLRLRSSFDLIYIAASWEKLLVFFRWRGLPSIIANDIGGVRTVELVGTIPWDVRHTVLELNLLLLVNDDDTMIELVGNGYVPVAQPYRIGRKRAGIAVGSRVGEILEYDSTFPRHLNDSGVTGICD